MEKENLKRATKVMEAAANGLAIQVKKKWVPGDVWTNVKDPAFNWEDREYRIKPEAILRPYKSADEAFREAQKHNFWILAGDSYFQVTAIVDREGIFLGGEDPTGRHSFEEFSEFRWADDKTRCGIITME